MYEQSDVSLIREGYGGTVVIFNDLNVYYSDDEGWEFFDLRNPVYQDDDV